MPIERTESFLAQNAKDDFTVFTTDIFELYNDIPNQDLKKIFAALHTGLNVSFRQINDAIRERHNDFGEVEYYGYFHAQDSRDLLRTFEKLERIQSRLNGTEFSFSIRPDYAEWISECKNFVRKYNGTQLPSTIKEFEVIDVEPIFFMSESIPLVDNMKTIHTQLKAIGGGSYANVFSYIDPFYGFKVALKRAKSELEDKELLRFRLEFDTLKELHSPYVVDVYFFCTAKNEYTMEFMDDTIYEFVEKHNTKLTLNDRKRYINQICRGLSYIHSQGHLHRDISLKNALIKHYDDTDIAKIGDFGLVKVLGSTLTSLDSEIKGSLNDPDLVNVGFGNYEIRHETFALTRLCFYILTGRTNVSKQKEGSIKDFWRKGTSPNLSDRFASVDELWNAVKLLEQE